MKVGILSDIADNRGTGPGNIMYNLVSSVIEASPHEVIWLHRKEAESDLKDKVPHMKVDGGMLESARQIREEDFDILHMDCISRREMVLYPFLIDTTFMATQYGDAHFASSAVYPRTWFGTQKKRWAQKILHMFHEAITVSSHSAKRNFVGGGLPEDKLVVASPGLDRGYRDAEALPREERENVLFHVSNFQPIRKNPALLIQSFENVRQAGHDVELKIAGDWWEESFLEEQTEDDETREHIHLLGHIDNQELKELYQTSLAFLVPTRHEGFPIPPMEAMAYGTPVVSNNVYAVPETVGDAGILVDDPNDIDGFTDAVLSLVEDEELWNDLSEKSVERVETLRWEDTAEIIAGVYDRLEPS